MPYFKERLGKGWIIQPKVDGWRMQIIQNGTTHFWGRRLTKEWNPPLPDLSKTIPQGTILDCELCTKEGRQRIPSLMAGKDVKPKVYIFDIIYLKNHFVGNVSLELRQEILNSFDFEAPYYLIPSEKYRNDLDLWFRKAKQNSYEGVVVKRLISKYQVGKECPIETPDWRKYRLEWENKQLTPELTKEAK
jgi:ATP-dependent DNA ligase